MDPDVRMFLSIIKFLKGVWTEDHVWQHASQFSFLRATLIIMTCPNIPSIPLGSRAWRLIQTLRTDEALSARYRLFAEHS